MGIAIDYKKRIIDITKELKEDKIRELIDFAQFLKEKQEGFSYMQVRDSAAYVREQRAKEYKRTGSGKKFIEELIAWQKSNS